MSKPCFFLDQKGKKDPQELAHRHFDQHIDERVLKSVLEIRCLQHILKVLQSHPVKLCLQKVTVMQAEIKNVSYRYNCKCDKENCKWQ